MEHNKRRVRLSELPAIIRPKVLADFIENLLWVDDWDLSEDEARDLLERDPLTVSDGESPAHGPHVMVEWGGTYYDTFPPELFYGENGIERKLL